MAIKQFHGILSPEEANELLDHVEDSGLHAWDACDTNTIKQHCLVISDKGLAYKLYKRLESLLPLTYDNMQIVGVSDRFKITNYKKNQRSLIQKNGPIKIPYKNDQRIVLSLTVFLNDNFTGGDMLFLEDNHAEVVLTVKPKIGDAVLYDVNCLYTDNTVVNRQKYVLTAGIIGAKTTPKLKSYSMTEQTKNILFSPTLLNKSMPELGSFTQQSDDELELPSVQHTDDDFWDDDEEEEFEEINKEEEFEKINKEEQFEEINKEENKEESNVVQYVYYPVFPLNALQQPVFPTSNLQHPEPYHVQNINEIESDALLREYQIAQHNHIQNINKIESDALLKEYQIAQHRLRQI